MSIFGFDVFRRKEPTTPDKKKTTQPNRSTSRVFDSYGADSSSSNACSSYSSSSSSNCDSSSSSDSSCSSD